MSALDSEFGAGRWSEKQFELGTSILRLEQELHLGLALKESRSLRLALLAGYEELLLALPIDAGWARVVPGGLSLSRDRPTISSDTPSRRFVDVFDDAALMSTAECGQAIDLVGAHATKLLASLFSDDRRAFNQLLEWAPLLESSAYATSSRIVMVLDEKRRETHEACIRGLPTSGELVVRYRKLVDALGRVTLFSTDAGSRFLAQLATSFDWVRWTPSFSLARERDLWGTLIGARAASRFGPGIIERYLEMLRRARHPMFALDAITGLTAIGLRYPSERDAIARGLDAELTDLADRTMLRPDFVFAAHAEARKLLADSGSDRIDPSRKRDAFNAEATGRMPVFEHLSGAVTCPAWKFIPAANEKGTMSPHKARETFTRAWSNGTPDLAAFPDAAFGHA